MSDIAAEAVVDKENRANLVSAEPAPQKAALPADQVRVGTPQGCAGAGRDRMVRLHAEEARRRACVSPRSPPRAALACRRAAGRSSALARASRLRSPPRSITNAGLAASRQRVRGQEVLAAQ
jgi:hypothetical protein